LYITVGYKSYGMQISDALGSHFRVWWYRSSQKKT